MNTSSAPSLRGFRRWKAGLAAWLACLAALVCVPSLLGQQSPQADLYAWINAARLAEGLAPLSNSKLLTQAAQRHADDIAAMGTVTHQGSDGTDYRQRIREARYDAWEDGLMVNETYWMGLGTARDAVTWMRNDPESWQVLTASDYREIGIGYAEDGGIHFYVINVGSRPGVVPIFLNDGAELTDSPQVAVRLTNEEAVPLGEGTWMGKAIEVRLSASPEFGEIPWQPWEPLLPWLLEGTAPGEYAVYVQYRDGAGRVSTVGDTIQLVAAGSAPLPTPFEGIPTPAPQTTTEDTPLAPTAAPAEGMPAPSPEVAPPAATLAPTSSSEALEPLLTPYPTWTPLPADATMEETESSSTLDWPVLFAIGLQAVVAVLGLAAFLRRR